MYEAIVYYLIAKGWRRSGSYGWRHAAHDSETVQIGRAVQTQLAIDDIDTRARIPGEEDG